MTRTSRRPTPNILARLILFALCLALPGAATAQTAKPAANVFPKMTNPKTGQSATNVSTQLQVPATGETLTDFFRFDYRWEMAEGIWAFQVIHKGKVIAEQRFKVILGLN